MSFVIFAPSDIFTIVYLHRYTCCIIVSQLLPYIKLVFHASFLSGYPKVPITKSSVFSSILVLKFFGSLYVCESRILYHFHKCTFHDKKFLCFFTFQKLVWSIFLLYILDNFYGVVYQVYHFIKVLSYNTLWILSLSLPFIHLYIITKQCFGCSSSFQISTNAYTLCNHMFIIYT